MTPTLASASAALPPGGAHFPRGGPSGNHASRGFTLLELLIVVAIVALASAGVGLALRDSAQSRLDTQAQRLAALLESARAQSRTLGVPVRWRATPNGFAWDGLPATGPSPLPTGWTEDGVSASSAQPVLLGPEPLIPPQSVRLWLPDQPERSLQVGTDGVRPFAVQPPGAAPP